MGFIEIIVLSLGLAMDATAVSLTDGLSDRKIKISKALLVGLTFGFFQAMMPLLGFLFGNLFAELIETLDHWIALVLLGYLGGKMLYDGFKKGEEEEIKKLNFKNLLIQGVATSIDAFAVGISFATLHVDITLAVCSIGIITMVLSTIGVLIGKKFGDLLNNKATILGGLILVGMGIKIFIEHMFF